MSEGYIRPSESPPLRTEHGQRLSYTTSEAIVAEGKTNIIADNIQLHRSSAVSVAAGQMEPLVRVRAVNQPQKNTQRHALYTAI